MAGECTSNAPTTLDVAVAQAGHLWRSFERQQIALWYDKYRRYIVGVDPRNPECDCSRCFAHYSATTMPCSG